MSGHSKWANIQHRKGRQDAKRSNLWTKVIAEWDPRCALGVVLASKGYPTAPRKGDVISGTELQGDDTITFHAGTKFNDKGELVTSGGRVLCVVGLGDDLHQARDKAYKALDKIHFDGMQYRKDIGHRAL